MKSTALVIFILAISSSYSWANQDYSAQSYTQGDLKSAYFDSARNGNIPLLAAFYQAGLTANVSDDKGYTALILAAYNGQAETVDYLLQSVGADPCQQDKRGNTALMGALFKGNFKIVKTLVDADCNLNQVNNNGQTAAMFAALFDRQVALQKLLSAGADIQVLDSAGNSLKDIAISQGNYDLLQMIEKVSQTSHSLEN